MINWTEEDVTFVAKNIVIPMLAEYSNQLADSMIKSDDIEVAAIERISNIFADKIFQLQYEVQRDRMFMFNMLKRISLIDVERTYQNYCEEFDKLNKHLLDK